MKEFLLWLIAKIGNEWFWPAWSNFRWKKSVHGDVMIEEEEKIKTIPDIRRTACNIYSKFNYEEDGLDELGDSVVPPPQNYLNYKEGTLCDDCDGFHSTMYHFMHGSNIECYLLSVNAIGCGHCVILFKLDDLWRVCDYTSVTEGHSTAAAAISSYDEIFEKVYQTKSKVFYNGLTKYDYLDGKFKAQSIESLDGEKGA